MFHPILRVILVLAIVVALGIWMHSFTTRLRRDRRRHWVNGLIQPSVPLQPAQSQPQPQPQPSSVQPMDMSQPATALSEPVDQLDPMAQSLIAPGSELPQQLCAQTPLIPGCPLGQQYGGMTLMAQTIYPNSYLPAAVYNTSAFVPGCEGFNYAPNPCYQ